MGGVGTVRSSLDKSDKVKKRLSFSQISPVQNQRDSLSIAPLDPTTSTVQSPKSASVCTVDSPSSDDAISLNSIRSTNSCSLSTITAKPVDDCSIDLSSVESIDFTNSCSSSTITAKSVDNRSIDLSSVNSADSTNSKAVGSDFVTTVDSKDAFDTDSNASMTIDSSFKNLDAFCKLKLQFSDPHRNSLFERFLRELGLLVHSTSKDSYLLSLKEKTK